MQASSRALGLSAKGSRVLFEEGDDGAGDIDAGRGFDAFEARRRVDLHDQWPTARAQHVDAAHIEAHRARRLEGGRALRRAHLDSLGMAAAVKIGAEITLGSRSLH